MKINKLIRLWIVGFMLLAIHHFSLGQSTTDSQLWTSVGIYFEPTNKWSFGVEEQWRLKEGVTKTDEYFYAPWQSLTHLERVEAFDLLQELEEALKTEGL